MPLVLPAPGPTPAPAPAAETIRSWTATLIVSHQPTSARLASTRTGTGSAIRVTSTATGARVPASLTAWAATRDISCSVSRVCACLGRFSGPLRFVLLFVQPCCIHMCLLVQMAPVWQSAQQATTRTSRGRNASRATLPVSPASEGTATSASHAKPTYSVRAKSAWRPASTGSLTCSPSSCAAHPSH